MDPRRFDDLTRSLAGTHSRRTVLKGLAGTTLGGLLVHLRGGVTAAKPKPPKPDQPKSCRPEGHKSKDHNKCCSLATSGDVCCAVGVGDPCAVSGCCGGVANCENGTCCLGEGAELTNHDAGACCSGTASGESPQVCCAGGFGDSCAISGCCADGVCYQGRCVDCLPEGANHEAEGYAASACCSGFSFLDICCGEVDGTCVSSRCCAGNVTCYNGLCAECLPEGTLVTAPDVGYCCSLLARPVGAGEGRCCGVMDGTCATTQCCAGEKPCHQGTCVNCLPNGAPTDNPDHCCSKSLHEGACVACLPEGAPDFMGECCAQASQNGICCAAELYASCAVSGCCDPSGATPFCIEGFCTNCLPEGHVTVDPADCCSGLSNGDACCGEADGPCFRSGCCGSGLDCCLSVCYAQCPPGQARNPDTCVCESDEPPDTCIVCSTNAQCLRVPSADGTFFGASACCNGCCCPLGGDVCQDGICGRTCSQPDVVGSAFCEVGTVCLCRAPNGTPRADGCTCCPACPPGSFNLGMIDCQGNCGDCCSGCVRGGDGVFRCAG